jgi:hypothetical protein
MFWLIGRLIVPLWIGLWTAAPLSALQSSVRVVLITPASLAGSDPHSSLRSGAYMGAAEAVHTAKLTRTRFYFTHYALDALDSAHALLDSAHIVISSLDPATRDAMRRHTRALVVDVNELPPVITCDRGLLYISAPARALGNAVLWDSRLEKYGAQQLNERFTRATDRAMGGDAWLGWFATKLALELYLRARTTQQDSLATVARSARARFDGHKGRPLSFDDATGALIQPLYRSNGNAAAVSEVPEGYDLPTCLADGP